MSFSVFTKGTREQIKEAGGVPLAIGAIVDGEFLKRVGGEVVSAAAGGGGVSDGDKGDITVSGGGATWTIDPQAVTLAKQADVATSTVFYRKTAGTGAPEVQTLATLKTDLGLTGTNSGDQTSIVGITGTKAEFDAACTDGNFLYVGDVTQYTDELAQDAVGAMVDASLTYVDGTPLLQRAALTGDVTAPAGSNATTIAAGVVTPSKTSITGTPDGTKYLRDDWSWQAVAGGGSGLSHAQVMSRVSMAF